MDLKCAILKPGVYNLNRLRILIREDEEGSKIHHNFVSETKLTDDILISVTDSSDSKRFLGDQLSSLDKPLISLD